MFQTHLNNLADFFIFWKNLVKYLVTYVTKCMTDAILKAIIIKQKFVNFKQNPLIILLTSKHCIATNTLLISPILCPYLESCFYIPG